MTKQPSASQQRTRNAFRKKWGKRFRATPSTKGFKEWARSPTTDTTSKHTYYVTIEVEANMSGSPPFARTGEIVPVTLALLRRRPDGRLVPMTYDQFARNFELLLEQALRRANFTPARETVRAVRAIFRHKDK